MVGLNIIVMGLRYSMLIGTWAFSISMLGKWQKAVEEDPPETSTSSWCPRSVEFQDQLIKLSISIDKLLQSNELPYFLCYDALWGQLHFGTVLPWRDSVEFCMFEHDYKEVQDFEGQVKAMNLSITYYLNGGIFNISDPTLIGAAVHLIPFRYEIESNMFCRTGLKNRSRKLNAGLGKRGCFSPEVIFKPRIPLPRRFFHSTSFSVPHRGLDLQAELYPDNYPFWENNNDSLLKKMDMDCWGIIY